MRKSIPPLDLMFLLTETANSPKHVSALMTFVLPASGASKVVREIADAYRAAKPVAPFDCVAEFPLTGMPRWKAADSVDMDRHVHHIALPAGATHGDLLTLVQGLQETLLDRNRPGFDVFLIEGLPGNAFAIFVKIHHAIVDGASAMSLLLASMNEDADAKRIDPFFAIELSTPRPKPPKGLVERALEMQDKARTQTTAIADLYVNVLKKGLGRLVGHAKPGSEPFSAGRTPLNTEVRTPRSFATLSLPLAEMRAAGKAFGGTLNDVALTVVDAGLQRYLAGLGKPVAQALVAACPISLRQPGDNEVTTKASAMFVPLGSATASIVERMQAVIAGMTAAKAELQSMSKDTAMLYAIVGFGLAEAGALLSKRRPSASAPMANFILSNVPGSSTPRYLNRARMTGMFPVSIIGAGVGMNVTLASYAGSMDFGFVGNGLTLPNLTELARQTREAFDELRAAAAARAPAATPVAAVVETAPRKRRSAARKSK